MRSFSTELTELVAYFNVTYVSGQVHSIHRPDGDLREHLRRSAPMFPRPVWNVDEEMIVDGDWTNNLSETRNKAFFLLVGYSHPSVLVMVENFKAELSMSEQLIELDARGQSPVKTVKCSTQQLQRCCTCSVRIDTTATSSRSRLQMRPDVNVYMTLSCRYYTNTMITKQEMSSAYCYCFI